MTQTPKTIIIRLLWVISAYVALLLLAGHYGHMITHPIRLFVTTLHELGHGFGAIISGGKVVSIDVNLDGSGLTITQGGQRGLILLGGYIGSAILGNLLFLMGVYAGSIARVSLISIGLVMIISALIWYSGLMSSFIQIAFGAGLLCLGYKKWIIAETLMFLGLASLIHIISDFNVGPRSDLHAYAELFPLTPAGLWAYIWLFIVLLMTGLNLWGLKLWFAFKTKQTQPDI